MAAWLIEVPLMSYLAGSLAQPPSRRANTEKASALRMVESFADEAGAAGGLRQAVRGCSRAAWLAVTRGPGSRPSRLASRVAGRQRRWRHGPGKAAGSIG